LRQGCVVSGAALEQQAAVRPERVEEPVLGDERHVGMTVVVEIADGGRSHVAPDGYRPAWQV